MYDIVIIGGGPGGYRAAEIAGKNGLKTALITEDHLGGTCLNRGCIPTKSFFSDAKKQVNDYNNMWERKNSVVGKLRKGIDKLMKISKVDVYRGHGELKNAGGEKKSVFFSNDEEKKIINAKNIIIATGSKTSIPPFPGIEKSGVLTSDDVLEKDMLTPENTRSLIIVGGGFIALEFAWLYNRLGINVTLLVRRDILMGVDANIRKKASSYLKKQGVNIIPWFTSDAIHKSDNGLQVTGNGKKGDAAYEAEKILICTGRSPKLSDFGLENSGVEFDKKGINTDEHYQTNIKGVYAIGDVNGKSMLAHTAEYQGISAVYHILGKDYTVNYGANPWCVFMWPEVASVGLTEEEARDKNINYKVGKSFFMANGMALAMDDYDGFIKIITDENDVLIGVHMIGPYASIMISEAALAVDRKLNAFEVAHCIHPHPTLSECFKDAVFSLLD